MINDSIGDLTMNLDNLITHHSRLCLFSEISSITVATSSDFVKGFII